MNYDFDKVTDRSGTDSLKWGKLEGVLPMWVADMDIETFPGIKQAISKRASHGIYGYTMETDSWAEAYRYWWQTRHGFNIDRDWLVFVTGVVPAISSAVRKLTTPGEKVLIQTPVYSIFFNSILNNGRFVVENKLCYDKDKHEYSIDWDDLVTKLRDPQVSLMILCNPQNPSGNIWDKDTLIRIGELCKKNNVRVISDEIHCDIVAPGMEYVPFASASQTNREISVTLVAPTKTFNIAGLQTAAMVIPDPDLRHKMWRSVNTDEVGEGGCFAYEAVKAAFTPEGGQWLDQLREYLWNNRQAAEKYINSNIRSLKVVTSNASYLMWADASAVTSDSDRFIEHLEKKAGLMLNSGKAFGGNGDRFVRINLACPKSLLEEGLTRLNKGTNSYNE
ncbi:MAG: pyridoxal phosphate-dependent aminotransferase [Saccharofermentans sp.]|nr:pyridoxal phosphate-dependent aminotransferase [Saccharofermentans sp.]